jgi:hypothetical protein
MFSMNKSLWPTRDVFEQDWWVVATGGQRVKRAPPGFVDFDQPIFAVYAR